MQTIRTVDDALDFIQSEFDGLRKELEESEDRVKLLEEQLEDQK